MSVQGKMVIPAVNVRLGYGPHQFCDRCGEQIHFVRTVKGKLMPCDLELVQGDGRKTLVTHIGQTFVKAGAEIWGYEPHFGSCGRNRKNVEG